MTVEARSVAHRELHGEALARVADAAPVMIWTSGSTPENRHFSGAFRAFTGTSAGAGADWLACVHREDVERCRGIFAASLQAQAPFTLDFRLQHLDGSFRWVTDSATPCILEGTFAGYSGACIDIHERRVQEDLLAERTRVLRLGARRHDDFLATLAHEMRNPLAPIVNAAALLHMMEKDAPRLTRIRDIIERQGEALKRLANDLSDITRLASHRVALRREPVAVQALVAAAADSLQQMLGHAGHQLAIEPFPSDLRVNVDRARVQQALGSLLSNAAKFMIQPGTIGVAVSANAGQVRISISDAGAGISAEALPRIFDLWGPHERPLPRTTGGLGVGLAIARRIARLHGGDIQVRSDGAGCGAVFVLSLPRVA